MDQEGDLDDWSATSTCNFAAPVPESQIGIQPVIRAEDKPKSFESYALANMSLFGEEEDGGFFNSDMQLRDDVTIATPAPEFPDAVTGSNTIYVDDGNVSANFQNYLPPGSATHSSEDESSADIKGPKTNRQNISQINPTGESIDQLHCVAPENLIYSEPDKQPSIIKKPCKLILSKPPTQQAILIQIVSTVTAGVVEEAVNQQIINNTEHRKRKIDDIAPEIVAPGEEDPETKLKQQRRLANNIHCQNHRAKAKKHLAALEKTVKGQEQTIGRRDAEIIDLKKENLNSKVLIMLQKVQIQKERGRVVEQQNQLDVQKQQIISYQEREVKSQQNQQDMSEILATKTRKINELNENIKQLQTVSDKESSQLKKESDQANQLRNFAERLAILETSRSMDQILNVGLQMEAESHERYILRDLLKRLEMLEANGHMPCSSTGQPLPGDHEPEMIIKRFIRDMVKRIETLEETSHVSSHED